MTLRLPELSLVLLIGPSGSGKSTFARRHFKPTEVVSSDVCRGIVSDDENDQSVTPQAFELLNFILRQRLALGKFTVVDVTNDHAVVDIVIDGAPVSVHPGNAAGGSFVFALPGSRARVRLPSVFQGALESVDILSAEGRSLRRLPVGGPAATAAPGLPPGMYTLRFNGGGKTVSRRALIPE